MEKYDVIIVGSGPAAIFSALTLEYNGITNIAIFEKGRELHLRDRKMDVSHGWGGSGAFCDGKLILSSEVGGWLNEFISPSELSNLIDRVDNIYLNFGAPNEVTLGSVSELEDLQSKSKLAGMEFIPTKVRHLGTENCGMVLSKMRNHFRGFDIFFETPIKEFIVENKKVVGVVKEDGSEVRSKYVICGPGRAGAEWMRGESERIGLSFQTNPVDIGVRIELSSDVFDKVTGIAHDTKFVYYSKTFDDKVRTFCVNPCGQVILEKVNGVFTVNGHSYKSRKTSNTNFAVLVSIPFKEEPFRDAIAYGKYIVNLANILGSGVIVQRLGDLLAGRRSTVNRISKSIVRPTLTEANPGDLSLVLPYRYLKDIIEMLEALDKVTPGVFSKDTLLYGVEVKFYTNRIKVSKVMESEIENLFLIGDGAGITRGLVQASVSGLIAASEIVRRMEHDCIQSI